jgi:hypothetical protein
VLKSFLQEGGKPSTTRSRVSASLLAILSIVFIVFHAGAQQLPPNPVPSNPTPTNPTPPNPAQSSPAQPLPDAPQPAQSTPPQTTPVQTEQPQPEPSKPDPCHVKKPTPPSDADSIPPSTTPDPNPAPPPAQQEAEPHPCPTVIPIINMPLPNIPLINWYARILDGPKVKPMTPREKAWLAFRNVVDPFNGLTIFGSSAIAVGINSHSDYGPGMWGFARYVGVSYTQDITGEFFGTFLIPSIAHQDPHYHRMPTASIKRRIAHAAYQVLWTQGDNGRGMLNYADLVGFGIDDEIGNLYVPGQKTNASATAERYGIALATAPIDNYVSEFLPDIARHLHVQIVVIQQIINQIANRDAANSGP